MVDEAQFEARERHSLDLPKQAAKVERSNANNRSTNIEIEDLD